MPQYLDTLIAIVTLVVNVFIFILNTRIKADIANVKVYMHEKFLSREEFSLAMNPPTFAHRKQT